MRTVATRIPPSLDREIPAGAQAIIPAPSACEPSPYVTNLYWYSWCRQTRFSLASIS